MPQWMLFALIVVALVLPFIGAIALRLTRQRLEERGRLVLVIIVFGVAFGAAFALARSDISSLRIAGLTVMQPIAPPVAPVSQPPAIVPTVNVPSVAPTATPGPTAMIGPTATPEPTATLEPTVTPEPTATPEPTVTPEPTATLEPTVTSAPQSGSRRYVVQPGDTLRAIAERNGVTVEALLRTNNLTPAAADNLRVGQELIIP